MRNLLTTAVILSGMFLIGFGGVGAGGFAAFAEEGDREGEAANITAYCPSEAKFVAVLNVAVVKKSEPFKSILGRETLFDFVINRLFEKKPEFRDEWEKLPLRPAVESIAPKVTNAMVFDIGTFVDYTAVFEGEFDAETPRKLAEEMAKADGVKYETKVERNFTRYSLGDISILAFGMNTIAIGSRESLSLLCKHLESAEKSKSRCVSEVRKLLRGEGTLVAWAIEDSDRSLFGFKSKPYIKSYDISQGTIQVRAGSTNISYGTGYENSEEATIQAADHRKVIQELASDLKELAVADPLSKAAVVVDGKRVQTTISIPADALGKSVSGLFDRLVQ